MEIQHVLETIETILKAGTIPVILVVIFLLIYHWNKIEEFASSIQRLFIFSKKKKDFGRIRSTLQSDINKSILEITKEAPGCFTEAVKIEWLSEGKDLITVDEKAIYLKLNKDLDVDQLFLRTLSLLFERAFLIESRRFLHNHLFTGLTLILSKRIIANSRFRSATPLFYKSIHNPKLVDKSVAHIMNELEYLETKGLLTRVFLLECTNLSEIIGIELLGSHSKWDINNFLSFIVTLFKTLENKEQRIDFEFKSKTLNIAHAILADSNIGRTIGISFYINRTKQSILQGASVIYIIATGRFNTQLAYTLANYLTNHNYVTKKQINSFQLSDDKLENIPSVVIRCKTTSSAIDKISDDVSSNKPEILIDDPVLLDIIRSRIIDPEIQVVKTAWIKGYQAQVIVNSLNPQKNPQKKCIGKDGEVGKEISTMVGDFVRFIRWSPSISETIHNNLDNHVLSDVKDIQIDPANRTAIVYTSSKTAISSLSGPDNKTLLLAEAITDYSIKLEIEPKVQIREALTQIIPEINNDTIQIVNIAIIPNQEIRILVQSQTVVSPEKKCAQYIDVLVNELNCEEFIYFSNKCEYMIDTIYGSLFPLRHSEIIKIEPTFNDKYTVFVKDKNTLNRGLGKDASHIKAVNELLGVRIQLEIYEKS